MNKTGYERICEKGREMSFHRMAYPFADMLGMYAKWKDGKLIEFTRDENDEKFIDNSSLGILPKGFLDYLNFSMGDPFKEPYNLYFINDLEREVIEILARHLGADPTKIRGYICSAGTEGNMAGMWYGVRYLNHLTREKVSQLEEEVKKLSVDIEPSLETQLKILQTSKIISEIKKPIVYFTKTHTHFSMKKICKFFDLSYVEVECNSRGEMVMEKFSEEIQKHSSKEPHRTALVVANVGSTMYNAIDNVPEISKILKMSQLTYAIHADAALMGPALPVMNLWGDGIKNYFDDLGINSMAISGHKFFGITVSGIILVRTMECEFDEIGYVGNIRDSTISGTRSGLNIVLFHMVLMAMKMNEGKDVVRDIVEINLKNTEYLYNKLVEMYSEQDVFWNRQGWTVIFKRPSEDIIRKYGLMPVVGDKAGACVLQHVLKDKIDAFIEDLKKSEELPKMP